MQQLQNEHEQIKTSIAEAQRSLEELKNGLSKDTRILDAKRNEHDLLRSLVDSMEGYPESVKFLHKNKNWNHQSPILSDVIYVAEEYRAAIENLLEPYLNYYIVNTPEEAVQAIHLLEQNKKGKAKFFILEHLNNARAHDLVTPENTVTALDVIEADEQYQKLTEYLLGNVFITEAEDAITNDGAVLLHKSGKFVSGAYTLSGGSVGLFEGKKIGRAKNLEKLHEDIVLQEAIVQATQKGMKGLQGEIHSLQQQLKEAEIRAAQNEINGLNNALFINKNKIETLHTAQQQSGQRLNDIDIRLQNEQEEIKRAKENLHHLNEGLQQTVTEMEGAEKSSKGAEEEYRSVAAHYNELNLQMMRQQSKLQTAKQELSYKQNQVTQLQSQIESNTKQLSESSLLIEESSAAIEETETLLQQLQHQKSESEQKVNASNKEYYGIRNALGERESALRLKIKSREFADQVINEIKDKLNELKLQLAGMKERLQVEFKIHLDDIIDQPRTTTISLPDLQASSDKMKKRLENIGEVNPTAIEAFTEMKKRYEFILEQKNDLVTAKKSLLQTIDEVEASANQQFLEYVQ